MNRFWAHRQPVAGLSRRWQHSYLKQSERGSVTAEYVIATLAAVSFAGLLVVILRGDEVRQILTDMVRSALTFGG